ncbi:MAG: hypothetical protein NVS3B12_26940 [Acidimicrobiales bacterium]
MTRWGGRETGPLTIFGNDVASRCSPVRLGAVCVSLLCLDVLASVGLRLRRTRGPVALDLRTARPVFARPFGTSLVPTRLAAQFVKLGNPVPIALLVLALLALALWKRDWLATITVAVAPVLVAGAEALKTYFGRTEAGADAYPSGHTTALTAIAAVLVFVAWRRWGPRSLVVTVPIALVLSGGMVLTVVRLHAHLMSDALGGVLLGAGGVIGVAAIGALALSPRSLASRSTRPRRADQSPR